MGKVSMYDSAQIARGGYGPAGTGHPPPTNMMDRPERAASTFEILGKGLENAHAAADRLEQALDRIEPLPPEPNAGDIPGPPPPGHARQAAAMLQHLVSRLHRLADRLETHG